MRLVVSAAQRPDEGLTEECFGYHDSLMSRSIMIGPQAPVAMEG